MPYFFIVPAYLVFFAGLIGLAALARFIPKFRSASGYIAGGAIGTMIGFAIINAVVITIGIGAAWIAEDFHFSDWMRSVARLFVLSTLFIGPFIGSAVGILAGLVGGFRFVYILRGRQSSPL